MDNNKNIINKNNETDEIVDLGKIFNEIGKFFSNIFKIVLKFIFILGDRILINLKMIFVSFLIGAILGLSYFFIARPYYKSTMTLSSAYYKEKFLSNTISNLDKLASEENYNVLAKILRIPVIKAKSIRNVEIEPTVSANMQALIDLYKETEGDTRRLDSLILNANDSTYQLTVQVYDTTTLIGLDTILVNYIKNNKFVDKRIAIERRNSLLRKEKLIRESKNLDTLKDYIAQSYIANKNLPTAPPNGTNVTLNSKEVNPIDIYREDFRLYEALLKIDKQLFINSEIEIIDRFITFGKPASGSLIKHVIIGGIIGLIIALFCVFYKMLRDGLIHLRYNLENKN